MKTITRSILVAGLLAAGTLSQQARAAAPGPSGTFATGFTVQNTSGAPVQCQFQLNGVDGTLVYTSATFSIATASSTFTYIPSISTLASGQYSGVVSCDGSVAVISNHVSALSAGSYQGTDASKTALVWYSPNAQNNYFNYYSNFVVQNTTASSVNVTVEFFAPGSSAAVTSQTAAIPANGTTTFEQEGLSALAANTVYSAKITATGAVAVEQNIFGRGPFANQLFSFTPFTAGSTSAYAPAVSHNFFGFSTALTIQNLGATSASVTIAYGNGQSEVATIASNASYVILHQSSTKVADGELTSAVITSNQPVVALINQSNSKGRAASYGAFGAGALKVNMPIATKGYFEYNSAITCMNVGSTAAAVNIAYSNGATATGNAAVGSTAFFYQPSDAGLPAAFNGSAIATSTQPIVCVGNQDKDANPATGDFLLAYEGIGQ